MDAKQFLAEFGHIANAPNGVQRLRELILQLAVTGRIVSMTLNMDASLILKSIEEKKQTHEEQKKVVKKQAFIDRSAVLAPSHWSVCRLGDLVLTITGGGTPSKNNPEYWNGDIFWASVKDLKDDKYLVSTQDKITQKGVDESSTNIIPEGRLIVCTRMGLGKISINTTPVAINQDLKALELPEEVDPNYFYVLYKTRNVSGKGTTVSGIKQDKLLALPAALPPREEQSCIAAKVDELMTLCDKLEVQQQQKRKLQNHLRQSTLQVLSYAESPKEIRGGWERLAGNFSHLFSEAEDVVSFKGLILDLAVSGHLLNFTAPHEKTGRSLLEEINEERLKWATESEDQELKEAQTMIRKIKKQKLIYPGSSLPQNWEWGSFLEISQAVIDCHNKTAPYVGNGIHLIRTSDIRDGKMDLRNTKKITEETYDYWSRRMPPRAGDVFFTREAPMGEVALVPEGDKVCLGQRTMLLRLFPNLFNNQFLVYVIQSPSFQKRMIEAGVGMTVKHLRVGGVEDLAVPVPPKDEQDKIVTLIGKLFEICDGFAKQLKLERQISANLAATSVATLTGITNTQQEAPMKAPKTELKAPVRLGKNQPSGTTKAPLASLLSRHNGEMSANDLWQRFGGEIDAFYAQLKTEVSQGWVAEPKGAEMLEREAD